MEAAPGKLPPGGPGEPDPGGGAPGRFAGGDDPVLLLRVFAHEAGVSAGPDLPSQRAGYSLAGVSDRHRAIRFPPAGGRGAAPWRGPDRPGAVAAPGRAAGRGVGAISPRGGNGSAGRPAVQDDVGYRLWGEGLGPRRRGAGCGYGTDGI